MQKNNHDYTDVDGNICGVCIFDTYNPHNLEDIEDKLQKDVFEIVDFGIADLGELVIDQKTLEVVELMETDDIPRLVVEPKEGAVRVDMSLYISGKDYDKLDLTKNIKDIAVEFPGINNYDFFPESVDFVYF